MLFFLKRFSYFDSKTYGRLYYENTYLCDTLEGIDMLLEDRLPNTGEVLRKNKRPNKNLMKSSNAELFIFFIISL